MLPLSREELAELCGTRLHTVSRLLNRWQRAGWVRLGRRRVVLRKPHGLVALAEELEPPSLFGRKVEKRKAADHGRESASAEDR